LDVVGFDVPPKNVKNFFFGSAIKFLGVDLGVEEGMLDLIKKI
jgi:hypothetical protein